MLVRRHRMEQGTGMPIIQGTWRGSHSTKFGSLERRTHADEAARAQQKAEALRALKTVLSADEYDAMARQCQSGEREVRVENGLVLLLFTEIARLNGASEPGRQEMHA